MPLGIEATDSSLQLELDGSLSAVERVELTCTAWYETILAERECMPHHEYKSAGGMVSRHSEFAGKSVDLPVNFEHFQTDDGSQLSTATFPSGVTLESRRLFLTSRQTDVQAIDVRSLHAAVVGIKVRGQEAQIGFLFTFPREELAINDRLRQHLHDHFLFAQHTDTERMGRFLAALERKVYLREEVGEVQQLPKEDVEYIELAPTMMPNE